MQRGAEPLGIESPTTWNHKILLWLSSFVDYCEIYFLFRFSAFLAISPKRGSGLAGGTCGFGLGLEGVDIGGFLSDFSDMMNLTTVYFLLELSAVEIEPRFH